MADSGCSRNATEFCRVGSEEVLQSLRTTSRDCADCIGNAASLFIARVFQGIENIAKDVTDDRARED